MAMLASLIVNSVRGVHGKKGIKMTEPIDFMPVWDEEERENPPIKKQSIEEMKQVFLAMTQTPNKKIRSRTELKQLK